jgi:hypothetical protein
VNFILNDGGHCGLEKIIVPTSMNVEGKVPPTIERQTIKISDK